MHLLPRTLYLRHSLNWSPRWRQSTEEHVIWKNAAWIHEPLHRRFLLRLVATV
jgi:hypothetical protein